MLAGVDLSAATTCDVHIGDNLLSSLDLPALTTGDVELGHSPQLASLSIPVLGHAGTLAVRDATFSALDLSALTSADEISIAYTPNLTTVSAPNLESVNGYFEVFDMPSLTSIELPALTFAYAISVDDTASLTSISTPLASDLYALTVRNCAALGSLDLPALTQLGGLDLETNATLAAISMPVLDYGRGTFKVTNNSQLPTCTATALAAQGAWPAWEITISGNDDSATCP